MDGRTRRELAARGNRLAVQLTLGAGPIPEGAVEQLRSLLDRTDLVKVRVQTDDRAVCAAVIDELAQIAGCEVVQRIGRVALLIRPDGEPAA